MTSPRPPTSPMAAPRDATPELLTPRSKIKALLATVESSDDENGPRTKTPSKTMPRHVSLPPRPRLSNDGSDSESDSDVEIRPRGKLASRMRGATSISEQRQPVGLNDVRSGSGEEDGGVERQAARSPSPGLFVSPTPSEVADQAGSEDNLPETKSERFKALVEKKVQARLAKEAEEEARREKRRIEMEQLALEDDEDEEEDEDEDDGVDQQARPTRKAGKRAIEEMNRETQRMARNMQLAHEAKTRKVVTKENLFERFNYRPGRVATTTDAPNPSSMQASPKSGADKEGETPPSSPPADQKQDGEQDGEQATRAEATEVVVDIDMNDAEDDELPTLDEVVASAAAKIDKGKGKMPAEAEPVVNLKLTMHPKRRVRVRLPVPTTTRVDSDDELEVTATAKDKMKAVFDSVPLVRDVESQSIQALRALALVRSPGKEGRRSKDHEGMTPGELTAYLQQKARQQARTEREKRLKMLKAQGVTIETAEERERQMQEVEDILAKAREEGERIGQEEKAVAEREKKERGEVDPLDWDNSSADEEYEEGEDAAGSAIELSGSEDDEDDDENNDKEDDDNGNMLMDEEAPEVAHSDADADADADADDGDGEDLPVLKQRRARNQVAVLSDDEDETIKATPETKTPEKTPAKTPAKATDTAHIATSDPIAPGSVLRSVKKTFIPGLPVKGPAGLGLTQIFAGTMDDSQTSQMSRMSQTSRAPGPTQSMMPDFTQMPSPSFSGTNEDEMAIDSQPQPMRFNAAQSQMHSHSHSPSQFPSTIDPTQDGGLQSQTPLARRFADLPSTMDTVATERLGTIIPESPLVLKGRLRRKMDIQASDEHNTSGNLVEVDPPEPRPSIFSKMKAGARKQKMVEEFDKKKSKAKEMVEEQAAESEDEYAGLGGADGEDSDDDSNASVHEFLDDAAGNDVNERELAAFYADREVSNDQKQIEKLYKDITSGGLRKRRADYDLSDSDDGGEARRRMKRRQFAKMQKALYADERVKKIAKDPGTQAFLRTIEDQGSDEEMMMTTILGDASAVGSLSEETKSPQEDEDSPAEMHKGVPPGVSVSATAERRPPAHLRRTRDGKRPSNIGEIRETVSDLLDEQHDAVIPATAPDADSDEERPAALNASRNSNPVVVVDRMEKKKKKRAPAASSSRMAFAAGASASSASSSFKVPSLLRRATTNSLGSGPSAAVSSISGSGSSTNTNTSTSFGAEGKIKKGAGKKSGVHGFTRDLERNARIKKGERRREERKIRGAESRAGLVGGLLARGSFE